MKKQTATFYDGVNSSQTEPEKYSDRERVLYEYVALKEQIASLERSLEELKPQVEEFIDEGGSNNFELIGRGTFALQNRTTWEYSRTVQGIAEALKLLKTNEEQKGVATIKQISRSVIWRPLNK